MRFFFETEYLGRLIFACGLTCGRFMGRQVRAGSGGGFGGRELGEEIGEIEVARSFNGRFTRV